ncbi:hypothetical protein ACFSUK_02550 [Sphingobium scionense]|uniref:Uncharacterized protein n=2 Tax=Sphingomonadaceae TaxID=41297 RepID=A0A1L4A0B3_9SPHN|nr:MULTISPECIES: hypothetical protein [Sphingomonadaceae]API61328.1 hypothetical protein BSL82_17990 [Tardibacter chloracetimidivorans]MBB4151204.1 hypothetical protein [Sphingobium scionense]
MRKPLAVSASVALLATFAPAPALASDFGCQVLLCLSNPGGPTQYQQCVPPISKLWRQLALGKPFPSCTAGGVVKTKVRNKDSSTRRRVEMTYADGRVVTYSLAGIERAASNEAVGQVRSQ